MFDGWRGSRWIPLKMAGNEMIRIDWFSIAMKIPRVVFDRTIHLYRSELGGWVKVGGVEVAARIDKKLTPTSDISTSRQRRWAHLAPDGRSPPGRLCYAGAMPRFEPFAGLRYDAARVDPGKVIAPPYDVITPAERDVLAGRHSANSVRLELPEPDARAGLDRYQAARSLLLSWIEAGTLVRDPSPCLYGYRMTTPEGRPTTGVIGALGIDPGSMATIRPHEETLSRPTHDRLDLLRATRANLSPIWGLSTSTGLSSSLSLPGEPTEAAIDDERVLHQLWVIDDPAEIAAICTVVGSGEMTIADGHHRLETALRYRQETVGAGQDDPGADVVMALVVELAEDQVEIGPIHRVLSGLPDGLDLVEVFASWFDVTRVGEPTERTLSALGGSGVLALVMPSGAWLLSPRDGTAEAAGSPLDSSMVALVLAELPDHDLTYAHDWHEAATAISTEVAQAVVLMRPVDPAQVAQWATSRRRMPPKSTYFHPKPRTGMVFRPLDG